MGKKKTKETTNSRTNQTQTNTPFAPVLPGLTQLAGQIGNAVNEVQALPSYQGDFLALPGERQQMVIPAYDRAAALAGRLVDPAMGAVNQALTAPTFGGPGIGEGMQTFGSYNATQVQPVIEAAIAPYMRQLTEQILPGFQSAGIESGAYSNDRALATMPGQAIRDTGRMAAEVGAGISFQDFLEQQNRLQQGFQLSTQRGLGEADVLSSRLSMYPELLDTAMRMQTGAADLTAQGAAYDAAMRQAEIDNALARDTYNVQSPFRGLDMAAQLYGTFAPYASQNRVGTENSTRTTTTSGDTFGQLLQAGMGIAGMVGGFPGLGTAAGAAIGAMGGGANPMMTFNPSMSAMSAFAPVPQITPFNYNLYGGT